MYQLLKKSFEYINKAFEKLSQYTTQNMNRINFLKSEDYNIKNKYYVHIEESVLCL
jgi:hypothetical protein